MEVRYYKGYSYNLNREMEFKVYGHRGKPVLFIPCQAGRFYDFENFHMDDVFRPYIDAGEIMVFSIKSEGYRCPACLFVAGIDGVGTFAV